MADRNVTRHSGYCLREVVGHDAVWTTLETRLLARVGENLMIGLATADKLSLHDKSPVCLSKVLRKTCLGCKFSASPGFKSGFQGPGGNVPQVFQVDSTHYPDRWEEDVLQPALSIVQAYVQGKDPPVCPVPYEEPRPVDRHTAYTCEVCGGRIITGQLSWEAHVASRSHQRKARRQRLREAMKQHQLDKAQQSSEASASSGEDDFAQSFSAMLEDKKD
uniref:U1-type domain-containing protein n=1 Tax=Branchiostoma floridae TaxID=7739 RepID=C3Y233_BRAFL|eukprot:XP_002609913.1 hypothetical protein BRAFLDRAFT_125981 [Branchiostoma floridae]